MKRVDVAYVCLFNETKEKVLMVKNAGRNTWSLPGGAVEEGETLRHAVIREALEETGLAITPGNIIAVDEKKFMDKGQHAIFFIFSGTIAGGELRIQDNNEIVDVAWINIDEAKELWPFYPSRIHELYDNPAPYTYHGAV
ncbi:NUDIX hydrolase [Priestia taiwanensis]|uniref:DNA mismatch repair protein MutT n=1 Tax=Priestia taiwanensis TaxID=1347902 RepID=A0A917ER13_9BACI|nr:NUDIX hydrolase [Priestia taiwanensis]MBM7363236.1 8-oxo-dGTP diphosphatase [Priestia taiwanensis]GGE68793.1 DNA mismatch repair protein MutT [Priestia taiwanensis]